MPSLTAYNLLLSHIVTRRRSIFPYYTSPVWTLILGNDSCLLFCDSIKMVLFLSWSSWTYDHTFSQYLSASASATSNSTSLAKKRPLSVFAWSTTGSTPPDFSFSAVGGRGLYYPIHALTALSSNNRHRGGFLIINGDIDPLQLAKIVLGSGSP